MQDSEAAASGMTLVEVLVALVVFGLLLASLAAVMHFTFGFAAARVHGAEASAETVPVLDYLEALLGDMRPVGFDGETDRLTVVAPLAAPFADVAGLQVIRLGLAAGTLGIAWTPVGDGGLPAAGRAGSTALLPGLSSVRFRYFGRLPAGDGPAWHERWAGVAALPALIDITMTRANGGVASEMIVATRVTGISAPVR